MKKFLYPLLVIFALLASAPVFADNDTIIVDFSVGVDTVLTKKSAKMNKNLLYADCGLVHEVMRDGVSAFWYSSQRIETQFKFGDKLEQTDTIRAFGAFDYDEAKIKKKLGSEYAWFIESYGDKELIVRLSMFVKNDHGRLLFFRSGELPTTLTHEKPLEVYWDKVHTTMGIEQVYRIEPKEVPDSLQIRVTDGTSIIITVEALYGDVYVPVVENQTATQSQPFGLNLEEYKLEGTPIYVTVRRGTEANVSKLKLVSLQLPKNIHYDTTYTYIDTLACAGSDVVIDGKSYNRATTVYVYDLPVQQTDGYLVNAKVYNLKFEATPRVLDTVYVRSFPYTAAGGEVINQQGWKHRPQSADNICGSIIYSTYYTLDPNATGSDTTYVTIDTVLCAGSVFEYEGRAYTEPQTIRSTSSVNSGTVVVVTVTTIHLSFFETPRNVNETVYVKSWPYIVDGVVVAAKQGWVNDTVPADNPCGMTVNATYYTLSTSGYDDVVKTTREVDTLLCQGSIFELEGATYFKSQNVVVVENEVVGNVLYSTTVTYHVKFVPVPNSVRDTVWVQKWPYTNGSTTVAQQGWVNDTVPVAGVCGDSIISTYYANQPVTEFKYVMQRLRVDTILCDGMKFELEGNEYTTPQTVYCTTRVTKNDTILITFYTYNLTFVEQPYKYDTVLVTSFPAEYDGVTATKPGEVIKAVAADNQCGQILYSYYFTYPVLDTVQRIEIDTLSCEGSVITIDGVDYEKDTTFTLYTYVPNGLVLEVSAITYSIEFDEQPVHRDTVYVGGFPANVDGMRVDQEGWITVEKSINSPCKTEIFNHCVIKDESIQWGKTCENAIFFEYGYDKWIEDTLWFACNVPELIANGISAYWNPLIETDSLEIAVFLNCETAPLETKIIAFDRNYHISPEDIQKRYLSQVEERGIDISTIQYIGVRFVPRGKGELIVLKSGELSDHYVINQTIIRDTICQGETYNIGDDVYMESFEKTVSVREVSYVTVVTSTVYRIIFVPTAIVYDTVWIDVVPYVTDKGTITQFGQSIREWVEDNSPCGKHQKYTTYALSDALFINEMPITVRPSFADKGQEIFIEAAGHNNLQVFDITGRQVLNCRFDETTIITLSQQGEYIVRITNNSSAGIQRVVIK